MIAKQFTPATRQSSILTDTGLIGKRVVVDTAAFDQQVGIIMRVRRSPFWGESHMVAYIVSEDTKGWTEYQPITELLFAEDAYECTDCGRDFHEHELHSCGYCAGCCNCATENTDDLMEDEDYQPISWTWQGIRLPY